MLRPKMLVTSWTICFCVDSFPNGLLQIEYNLEIFFLYSCLPSCLIIRFMGLWVAIIIIVMMIGWVGLAIKLLLHARKPSLDRWWPTVVAAWEFNLSIITVIININITHHHHHHCRHRDHHHHNMALWQYRKKATYGNLSYNSPP